MEITNFLDDFLRCFLAEEIKKTISTTEAEISKAMSSSDRQRAEVKPSLEEVRLNDASEEPS
jgi:hypothetical protein